MEKIERFSLFSGFELSCFQVLETYAKEIEVLEEKVRSTILAVAGRNQVEKMCLIDVIQRLGISNHFEKEIVEQLQQVFIGELADTDYDLYTVALHFRLCRQHGYNVSCRTFDKFKDSTGKFKLAVASDPRGMLALHEASQLRVKGEDILDEVLEFTATHLKSFESNLNPTLANQVMHALYQPHRRGVPRVEACHFISEYQADESKDESLLRLAKLDYNFLQLLHKKELLKSRMVECYFWALGVYFEARYSLARIMLAKTIAMVSVLDDTYDAYGTVEELQKFTDLVERWDISAINELPEYMRPLYRALLGLYEEIEEEMTKQGKSHATYYAREDVRQENPLYFYLSFTCASSRKDQRTKKVLMEGPSEAGIYSLRQPKVAMTASMKGLVTAHNMEAKWFIAGYLPRFDEYKGIASVTSTCFLLTTTCFLGMAEVATKEAFDWLRTTSRSLMACVAIYRLVDDVATYEVEKGREQLVTGIESYMKEHEVSKEEAMSEFKTRAEDAWKDLNKELMKPTSVSEHLLMRIMNLARLIDLAYSHSADGYTNPEKVLKAHILELMVNPIDV
ncbi:hypothetical protein RJ639_032446 [Escallonia herrerae]|uniref:Uncharacterized protein n=1 Tax=Escallonia herrerae TaxID=1293975 RepID=A0AA88X9N6_9ASTE|nr:hypothetical protein RJ639_032446 [Escallonia herrerae]